MSEFALDASGLTSYDYDAAYLATAGKLNLPLATTDHGLRGSATAAGVVLAAI